VILAIDRAGLVGPDGETHQGAFDLSYLCHMPNMTVLAPRNAAELEAMLAFAVEHKGPLAIRYPKADISKLLSDKSAAIEYGMPEPIAEGGDMAIISVGSMFEAAYFVFEGLGKKTALYNARFIKPINKKFVKGLLSYKHIFILEDNVKRGGYSEALMSELSEMTLEKTPCIHSFALPDKYIEQGTREELFKRYALDGPGILKKIKEIIMD